ncbi:MAG TPA: branched-chain amino acid ABC transporter permease [Spirochaetota bacterium]|nr:branched-chain amino acid ABC transporter permease [Spirochaetota bacterium]HOS40065.1 branched-chain amino acid ABC transporter permease [Spirochaetota bacterium]HPU90139.1 branched-chain amino acid ABC transporter permease [Spirochaetota bacterium]
MDIKRDYYEDIRLLGSGAKRFWFGVMMLALAVTPFLLPGHVLSDVNFIAINVIVAIGLNILVGFTGQVSLGHAGFFAIGAYATVLLMSAAQFVPFPLALLAAGLIAALFGFVLGLPSLKLEGPYLAIATLGFGMAITQIIGRFSVFGGRDGIQVPEVHYLDRLFVEYAGMTASAAKAADLYFIIIVFAVAMTIMARNIIKTRVGRAFIAIRDDDIAAQSMGVHVTLYKTLSFAVSAFFTGVAGGLYAIWLGYINPESFGFIMSVLFLAMVVVGGVGSIMGSVLGAIVISFLDLNLKQNTIVQIPVLGNVLVMFTDAVMDTNGIAYVSYIIFGLIMMLIVVFEPLGLFGFWIRIKKYWKTWPF